jgi:hypothetical protein
MDGLVVIWFLSRGYQVGLLRRDILSSRLTLAVPKAIEESCVRRKVCRQVGIPFGDIIQFPPSILYTVRTELDRREGRAKIWQIDLAPEVR